jgi:hypothetical protein
MSQLEDVLRVARLGEVLMPATERLIYRLWMLRPTK